MKHQLIRARLATIFLIIALTYGLCNECSAQTYNCGAALVSLNKIKIDQQIIVTDTTVTFKSQEQTQSLKRIKADINIYFTDGVMTHTLSRANEEGKAKGFAYNCILRYKPDARVSTTQMTYYCWQR